MSLSNVLDIYLMTFKQFKNDNNSFQWNSDKQVGAGNPKCIWKVCGILLFLGYNTGKGGKDDCSSWVIFANSAEQLSSQPSVVSNPASRKLSLLLLSPCNIKGAWILEVLTIYNCANICGFFRVTSKVKIARFFWWNTELLKRLVGVLLG